MHHTIRNAEKIRLSTFVNNLTYRPIDMVNRKSIRITKISIPSKWAISKVLKHFYLFRVPNNIVVRKWCSLKFSKLSRKFTGSFYI